MQQQWYDETTPYQYWLANIPTIGKQTIHKLLNFFGSAAVVYEATQKQLDTCQILNTKQRAQFEKSRREWNVKQRWETFQKRGIRFVTWEMPQYPKRLRHIYGAPYQLYIRGNLPREDCLTAAIVGARMCTEYGRSMAKEISHALAKEGVSIISGLAFGIDTCGHVGALEAQGETYGVLGCGVDICYPARNKEIYQKIWKTGGIISEYSPATEPTSRLFPERNRIISGLSDIVIVVEAREKSGSLITSDFALEQGKEIYAVPGRMNDELSKGCNRLIAQGAGIILSPQDFLQELGFLQRKNEKYQRNSKISLEKEESLVYSCLEISKPKSIAQLLEETEIDVVNLINLVLQLQKKGCIKEIFKNQYVKCGEEHSEE
ncbi:MAG: DNA-processing protein DprA [Lachnospiraceae bacterium]